MTKRKGFSASCLVGLIGLGAGFFSCTRPVMGDYPVRGIDVSHYQKLIDWRKIGDAGISFVFVKATEGIAMKDTHFNRNWHRIRKEGLRRGAYHFFRPAISAQRQAIHFCKSVRLEQGDFPPILDVEVLDGVSGKELREGVRTWMTYVELQYGAKPILYSNQKFYNRHLRNAFKDYPLWIARYNAREPRLRDGSKWLFWQYTNKGRLPGIEEPTDFNVFQGSLEELAQHTLGYSAKGE